jgi:hypothetical protein
MAEQYPNLFCVDNHNIITVQTQKIIFLTKSRQPISSHRINQETIRKQSQILENKSETQSLSSHLVGAHFNINYYSNGHQYHHVFEVGC